MSEIYNKAQVDLQAAQIGQRIHAVARWTNLAANWSVEPTLAAEIDGGQVFRYELKGVVRYRFIPNPYDPAQDAFYAAFDGTDLSGLIVARG